MSEAVDCTWPEQDAVWAWMEQHGITLTKEQESDLKESVTAPRISEMKARELAEDRLGRLLDWITQGQMSGCNYTYEAMHQAVESAFMEAVRQQEERAERAEWERDELLRTFAHTHVSIPPSKKLELDDDTCAKCGLDLRHPIHKPENAEKAHSALGGKTNQL